jgi:prepilin-type N-terminal cleavage/methylation domain-containing protein
MFHKFIARGNQGFTLIEALVTILILGISAAIATPSLTNWLDNKKVDYALAQIEGAIKEAQSTAVRKNQICQVSIQVSAEETVVSATPTSCLPTGSRNLQDDILGIENGNLDTTQPNNTEIIFSPKGTTPITTTDAVVVVHRDNDNHNYMKCLIISSGIGMIRTGDYEDTQPPEFSEPATTAQITGATSKCKTS